ncbi:MULTISPECIES: class I SAM-dependent methyltransferase [unclassified Haladaptatus]|uniref:class I SAM-dependent methyltransferase n=1 Tax=unclassified Haladaptatus TaxID=2622732 RepID=UPI0023E830D7|nr:MULTISPECIES: methyltransferase domain-containing protein [unclassified Haladaptatus]
MSGTAAAQQFYGRWARLYDVIATSTPGVGSVRDAAVSTLALEPGDTVLDMGCGTGANFPFIRERIGSDGTLVGVDYTAGMLDQAHARVEREDWANVYVVRGDASRPPVCGPVDAVISSFVVGMLGDPERTVGDWISLLRPGGRIVLLDAAQSSRLVGEPLNALFQAFVLASSPPGTRSRHREEPWNVLDSRVAAARRALEHGTVARTHEDRALGFVQVTGGRRPESNE